MPERPDHPFDEAALTNASSAPEAARRDFADARLLVLGEIELRLLDLAVQAPDDDTARHFELAADTVWRDALAFGGEHDLSPTSWLEADLL